MQQQHETNTNKRKIEDISGSEEESDVSTVFGSDDESSEEGTIEEETIEEENPRKKLKFSLDIGSDEDIKRISESFRKNIDSDETEETIGQLYSIRTRIISIADEFDRLAERYNKLKFKMLIQDLKAQI